MKVIGPIIFILFGALVCYFGYTSAEKGEASKSWPTVKGKITYSEVLHSRNGYFPSVDYEYSINGVKYINYDIDYGRVVERSKAQSFAKRIVKRFYLGSEVDIYYDPSDPEESVLIPGGNTMNWFLIAFGGIFIAIGLIVPISFIRNFY
ncbi:MAG: DUF3592 domain-containing protein [Lentisphaeraceae bacterium]|nr:DUF3592 domain-containing protein [Lentisphaeraceae bacterium]